VSRWRGCGEKGSQDKKIGDAAWEDRIALCPVTVLTTVTENREQEVMLSSPVSLAPPMTEQSRCHVGEGLIPVMMSIKTVKIFTFAFLVTNRQSGNTCKKYIFWVEIFSCLATLAVRQEVQ
jgi:3,4-dihydroxy-2-butanone 4-phosphate synthase